MAVESERECGGGRQGEIEVRVSPMREKPVPDGPVGGGEPSGGRWQDVTTHHHHTSIEIENKVKKYSETFSVANELFSICSKFPINKCVVIFFITFHIEGMCVTRRLSEGRCRGRCSPPRPPLAA